MADKTFSTEERAVLVKALRDWSAGELNQQPGGFQAEFLLDFITDKIGTRYDIRGLLDAQAVIEQRIETLTRRCTSWRSRPTSHAELR